MNRIVRLLIIAALVLNALTPGVASAQGAGGGELDIPEQIALQATLDLIRGDGHPIRATVESPFDDVFEGSPGVFAGIAESSVAAGQGLGDLIPFSDPNAWPFVTGHRPATNDYFVNSPYTVANVVEVTDPVSSCGPNEYREVALFLTRNGMATIGQNPNVSNDPGVGASEAVSLVCTAGVTSTLFILPQGDGVAQFATPYPIFELEIDGRHFVVFFTLDPFATYRVVASFASDTAVQKEFGFVRGEAGTYPDVVDPVDGGVLDDDAVAAIDAFVGAAVGDVGESPSDDGADTGQSDDSGEAPTDEAPTNEAPANEAPANEASTDEASATEETPAPAGVAAEQQTNTQQADETSPEGGSSAVPAIVAAFVAAAVAGAGFAIMRKKEVFTTGDGLPLLSDAEEIRVAGQRAGLPVDRGWQQVPFAAGREFRNRRGVTERESIVGDDNRSDVSFEGRPWQWSDASERNLDMDDHFAFWINEKGILKVGSPDNPYYFSELLDSSEFPVDYVPPDDTAPQPYDRKAEGSATTFDDNELPPA